jgi:hypothetical protein
LSTHRMHMIPLFWLTPEFGYSLLAYDSSFLAQPWIWILIACLWFLFSGSTLNLGTHWVCMIPLFWLNPEFGYSLGVYDSSFLALSWIWVLIACIWFLFSGSILNLSTHWVCMIPLFWLNPGFGYSLSAYVSSFLAQPWIWVLIECVSPFLPQF